MHRTAPVAAGDLQSSRPKWTPAAALGEPLASFSVVDEVDEYTKSVAGLQVEAVRTGLGSGPNRVLTVHCDDFMFTSSDIGFPLLTRTTIGDDHVVIGCIDAAPPGARWCEFDLRPGTVFAYGSGAEHTGVSLPGLRFRFAVITADRLAELAEQIESPLELPPRGQVLELTSAPNAPAILSSMSELAAAAANGHTSLKSRCGALQDAFVLALAEADRPMPARDPRCISSRHVVHQCLDYADAVGRIPSISELCLAAHVSERRLRKAFVEEYELPPSRFFRQWALGLAHQRLASVDDDPHTVTNVAMDLGFSHLGRFSGQYRKLYDEAPSMTLRSASGSS